MKPRDRRRHTGRAETGKFLRVPEAVLNSPNFLGLTTKAKALILDIGAKYNGHNNGDLAAPWSWMKGRGWRSKDTLQRAISELLNAGMIELTRQGGMHGPSLYAFTWFPIDETPVRLDVAPTKVASGKWKEALMSDGKTDRPPRLLGRAAPIVGAGSKEAA